MSYFFRTNDFELDKYEFDIECYPKFTKPEREIFLLLVEKLESEQEYSIIDLERAKYKISHIKKIIPKLLKKIVSCYVVSEENKKVEISFNLFDYVIFEDSKLIYNLSDEIKNSKSIGNFFSRVNLLSILQFKYLYTKLIFKQLLSYHDKRGVIEYDLDELKELLEIKKDTYTRYYNFENKVLNLIAKDIECAGITVWFEKIKSSSAKTSRVTGVKLHYVNQTMSKIHKDTNEIIKQYSDEIDDFAKAYEMIYNFKKFNTYKETLKYVEENKDDIFN